MSHGEELFDRFYVREVYRRRPFGSDTAARRARRLLYEHLTQPERAELSSRRCLRVLGSLGGVYYLSAWGAVENHCIQPDPGYPCEDVLLAVKTMIEANEQLFLTIAIYDRPAPFVSYE